MKKTMLGLMLGLFTAVSLTPAVHAARLGGKVGLFGNLGYSVFAMNEFNDNVEATNDLGVLTETLDEIGGGFTWNAGLLYGIADFLQAGVAFTSMNGLSEGRTDQDNTLRVETPAIELGPLVRLVLPVGEPLNVMLNAEVDWLHASQKVEAPGADQTFTGNNVSVKVGLGAEVYPLSFMSVGADAGYRFGRITELKDGDEVAQNLDGSNAELDYSGPFFLGGVRFYF